MIALDASALLAFLFREPGHDVVAAVLDESCISTVNLAEVLSRFACDGHDPREVWTQIAESPVELVPFLAEDAALAAALVPATRSLGLSLGDRACLALAATRKIPAYTADGAWLSLDTGIRVKTIR